MIWANLVAEMGSFETGVYYSTRDIEQWGALQPVAGFIAELNLMDSSIEDIYSEEFAAFFIASVTNLLDGSLVLHGRFLGCTDHTVLDATLATASARDGLITIHLCLGRPCGFPTDETEVDIHTTGVKFWDVGSFQTAPYVDADLWKNVDGWVKELNKPKPKRRAKDPKEPGTPAKAKKGNPGGEKGLSAEMRTTLREKLDQAKKKKNEGATPVAPADDGIHSPSPFALSPDSKDEELATGAILAEATKPQPYQETRHQKAQKEPKGIKDITTKSLTGQLALKAVGLAQERREKKEKKSKKKSTGTRALELLAKVLEKGSGSSKDKKKKKKKKRKILQDGTIVSCSESLDSSSEELEEDEPSSETDLEAPMKKKSRDHPGSVLSMLTSHVREQMDQASLLEVPGKSGVTDGVKVASYFAIHIKPTYPTHLRELREMFTLAATIDQLRAGDIARVGDSLAARFMALHQSMIDQGWNTARHMELHPMEESSAGSAAVVLATRKHTKLVDKVQGKGNGDWSGWSGPGRGRGKGSWKGSGDYNQGKGEKGKGKGKKGKGKGQTWDWKSNEWEKNKDTGDAKS